VREGACSCKAGGKGGRAGALPDQESGEVDSSCCLIATGKGAGAVLASHPHRLCCRLGCGKKWRLLARVWEGAESCLR